MTIQNRDGTVLSRSLLRDGTYYKTSKMSIPKLGVVIKVNYADSSSTRAAMSKDDRRGWAPEAVVWLTDDCAILPHVMIPPSSPSGIDNFEELLPRACTGSVNNVHVDENLSQVDPNDLDGDWCIVQFLDGNIQKPYISNWWPNAKNTFDPATSGLGNPKFSSNRGTALDQRGRYFRRINGVETTITKEGNTIISTARAGNKILLGGTSVDGRFPRSTFEGGGSILTYIKPSESLELSWDEQVDGIGPDAVYDPSLPQQNPVLSPPLPSAITNTKIKAKQSSIEIAVPLSFEVKSKVSALIEAPSIYLGDKAIDMATMSTPTMANFSALVAAVNALITVIKAPTPVVSGATVPTPVAAALTPLPSPTNVACTKVHIE